MVIAKKVSTVSREGIWQTSRGWIAGIFKTCQKRGSKSSECAKKTFSKVKITISVSALDRCQPCPQQICRAAVSWRAEISTSSNVVYSRKIPDHNTTLCTYTLLACWHLASEQKLENSPPKKHDNTERQWGRESMNKFKIKSYSSLRNSNHERVWSVCLFYQTMYTYLRTI